MFHLAPLFCWDAFQCVRRVEAFLRPSLSTWLSSVFTRDWGSFGQGWGVRIKGLVRFPQVSNLFLWKRMDVGRMLLYHQTDGLRRISILFLCVFYSENNWSWCLEIVLIYLIDSYQNTKLTRRYQILQCTPCPMSEATRSSVSNELNFQKYPIFKKTLVAIV